MALVVNPNIPFFEKTVVVDRMLEMGEGIDVVNANGETALMMAVKRNNRKMIEYLLEKGASPNIPDDMGVTPLMVATFNGQLYNMALLHYYGAFAGDVCAEYEFDAFDIADKQAIKKLLNLSAQHKISLVDDRVIKAYLYSRPEFANNEHLRNMNENELSSFIEFLAEPKMSKDKNARLYNEDALIEYLKPILKIDDEKEIGNLLTKLPKGRGMLGISATKIILEKLKEDVVTHREITDKLAETDKRFMAEEEIARQNQGKCFQLLPLAIWLMRKTLINMSLKQIICYGSGRKSYIQHYLLNYKENAS